MDITTRQKWGYGLAGLMSVAAIPSVLFPAPDGDPGPPLFILAIGTVLGVIGLVAVVLAWRGNARAARIAAGAVVLNTATGLPALFVEGIPAGIRIMVGVSILLTVLTVYLMFAPAHRSATVATAGTAS
ncbi:MULTISPECIES: hypothetical protein [unclassified Nocardioides]|uniref:hypothetical protein n=1 Tax=unclassified Nocardioides TaxID=2615069 RepID=UPI0006F776F0|nr:MULTISPECIES: hypothetical protein [unclassified Nocardioides]KRA32394.1 hypothetical protein ASD81_12520 [Nocardioides sp. Root614]KRA89047.1 hypothetical protein ASD84_12785 [Nocardioides sp. Root682]